MSNEHDDTINATLQIIFGAAGIFSVVIALLGLHHQDALVFVLYRRLRYSRAEAAYGMDDEIVSSDRIIGNQAPPSPWGSTSSTNSNTDIRPYNTMARKRPIELANLRPHVTNNVDHR